MKTLMKNRYPLLALVLVAWSAGCSENEDTVDEPLPPQPAPAEPLDDDLRPPPDPAGCESAPVAESWTYTYAADGRLLTADESVEGVQTEFEYAAGRLVSVSERVGGQTRIHTLTYEDDLVVGYTETYNGLALRTVELSRAEGVHTLGHEGQLPLGPIDLRAPAFHLEDFPELAVVSFQADPLLEALLALELSDPELEPWLLDAQFTERRTTDDQGRRVQTEYDWADREIAIVQSTTYEGAGHRLEHRVGGELLRVVVVQGPADAPLMESVDSDADGMPDRVTRWIRVPEVEHTEIDDDADGFVDHRTSIFFNAAGQRVLKYEDEGADGQMEWRKRYVYDAEGRRTYEARDGNADGEVDERWDYEYGAAGDLLGEARTDPRLGTCGLGW